MQVTEEELKTLEELGGALMSPKEIAIVMEWDLSDFRANLTDPSSLVYKSYYKGYFTSKAAINKSIVEHASNGSSPAQTEALKLIKNIEIENVSE